jgi:hypothetical protein
MNALLTAAINEPLHDRDPKMEPERGDGWPIFRQMQTGRNAKPLPTHAKFMDARQPNAIRLEQEQVEKRIAPGGSQMQRRARLRAKLFGHEFLASTTAPVTRLGGGMVEIVLCDGRDQIQTPGIFRFRFDGGNVTPKAEIDFSRVRKAGITLDGSSVPLHSVQITRDKLVASVLQWPGNAVPATLTVGIIFQISNFASQRVAIYINGFAILTATVKSK